MRQLHNILDNISATLGEDIDDSTTEFDLSSGQGATMPAVPFWAMVGGDGGEQMCVTNVSSDTVTAERGANGTSAVAHFAGDSFEIGNVAAQHQEVQDILESVFRFLCELAGGNADAVLYNAGDTYFEVIAQDTPDMTVKVQAGKGFANGRPVEITSDYTTAAITAPSANPRIDIVQVSQYTDDDYTSEVTIKTGEEAGSPSAPSPDSGAMKVAEIYCRVGMVSIKDEDDASNGYITDSRTHV